jgi:hypothetical protein
MFDLSARDKTHVCSQTSDYHRDGRATSNPTPDPPWGVSIKKIPSRSAHGSHAGRMSF